MCLNGGRGSRVNREYAFTLPTYTVDPAALRDFKLAHQLPLFRILVRQSASWWSVGIHFKDRPKVALLSGPKLQPPVAPSASEPPGPPAGASPMERAGHQRGAPSRTDSCSPSWTAAAARPATQPESNLGAGRERRFQPPSPPIQDAHPQAGCYPKEPLSRGIAMLTAEVVLGLCHRRCQRPVRLVVLHRDVLPDPVEDLSEPFVLSLDVAVLPMCLSGCVMWTSIPCFSAGNPSRVPFLGRPMCSVELLPRLPNSSRSTGCSHPPFVLTPADPTSMMERTVTLFPERSIEMHGVHRNVFIKVEGLDHFGRPPAP